jgi:F-type H+-transporting ATPase subunit alpha
MQQLNPSEISEIIKSRIDNLNVSSEAQNEGTIVSVSDGIIRIHGLADVMYGEMIEFDGGVYGMALNLERDSVGAVVLGDYPNTSRRTESPMHRTCIGSTSRSRTGRSRSRRPG